MAGARRPYRSPQRWSTIERDLRAQVGPYLAGVDEVGRGPLAGPVVACAVIMPPDRRAIAGVDDSKTLTLRQRLRLADRIRDRAVAWALGAASVREIDRFNIYHASTLAITRALYRLGRAPDHVIIDGRAIRTLPVRHTAIVHGDARCFSIACASILAKVTRDRVMEALGRRHPHYGWGHNAGYSTRDHFAALNAHGLTRHHRYSFMPVRQISMDFDSPPPDVSDDLAVVEEALVDVDGGVVSSSHSAGGVESLVEGFVSDIVGSAAANDQRPATRDRHPEDATETGHSP